MSDRTSIRTVMIPALVPVAVSDVEENIQRAREALVLSGFFSGMDDAIRAGQLDSVSGIITAIIALESLNKPFEYTPPPIKSHPVRAFAPIIKWLDRFQNRCIRLITRYDYMKRKNLQLAAELVELRTKWNSMGYNAVTTQIPTGGSGVIYNGECIGTERYSVLLHPPKGY